MDGQKSTFTIIIPCFNSPIQIERTCHELIEFFKNPIINKNASIELSRIILVDDGSNLDTKKTLSNLSSNSKIHLITLNKNYGQHPAIFAGVLNSYEDFIVTMDEDGEHNPETIIFMFEKMLSSTNEIIYAKFVSRSHIIRDALSKLSKFLISVISGNKTVKYFSSFRLIKGDVFRNASIYANNGSFLDIALGWISQDIGIVESKKRDTDRSSNYNYKKLFSHFGKLFFASGIRPLIFLFNFGLLISISSVLGIFYILYRRIFNFIPVQGWVSNTVVLMFFGGLIISFLGLIARYISSLVETSSGKPYFTIKNNKDA